MGFRALFDQRSRAAACWRGAHEVGDSIPPSPPERKSPNKGLFCFGRGRVLMNLFDLPRPNAWYGLLAFRGSGI